MVTTKKATSTPKATAVAGKKTKATNFFRGQTTTTKKTGGNSSNNSSSLKDPPPQQSYAAAASGGEVPQGSTTPVIRNPYKKSNHNTRNDQHGRGGGTHGGNGEGGSTGRGGRGGRGEPPPPMLEQMTARKTATEQKNQENQVHREQNNILNNNNEKENELMEVDDEGGDDIIAPTMAAAKKRLNNDETEEDESLNSTSSEDTQQLVAVIQGQGGQLKDDAKYISNEVSQGAAKGVTLITPEAENRQKDGIAEDENVGVLLHQHNPILAQLRQQVIAKTNNAGGSVVRAQTNRATTGEPKPAPPHPKDPYERKYMTRYDFKLMVKSNQVDPVKALRAALVEMVGKIIAEDGSAVVYAWKPKAGKVKPITKAADIPEKSVSDMQEYFNRASARAAGGALYIDVYLGHEKTFETIKSGLSWWLREEKLFWYRKDLQVAETRLAGVLIWSHYSIEKQLLREVLMDCYDLEVGLVWRAMYMGRSGPIPENQKVRALHVFLKADSYKEDYKTLVDIYSSTRDDDWPLGIRMRLVPDGATAYNHQQRTKNERLRNRQAKFLEKTQPIISEDISQLDYVDRKLNASLRTLLMAIPAPSELEENCPLFHAISENYRFPGNTAFVVMPQFRDEGEAIVKGLLTFLLRATQSVDEAEAIKKWFTAEAVATAENQWWDEEHGCVMGEEDRTYDNILAEGRDAEMIRCEIDLSALPELEKEAEAEHNKEAGRQNADDDSGLKVKKKNQQGKVLHEVDSVSTFGLGLEGASVTAESVENARQHPRETPQSKNPAPIKKPRGGSGASVTSQITVESRLSSVETRLDDVTGYLHDIFNLLMQERQGTNGNETSSHSAAREGTTNLISPVSTNTTDTDTSLLSVDAHDDDGNLAIAMSAQPTQLSNSPSGGASSLTGGGC